MSVTDQEKAAKARDAALQGALTQIEREFGKGTVMRMGDEGAQVRCEVDPHGRAVARPRARHRRRARADGSSRCSARSPPARRR